MTNDPTRARFFVFEIHGRLPGVDAVKASQAKTAADVGFDLTTLGLNCAQIMQRSRLANPLASTDFLLAPSLFGNVLAQRKSSDQVSDMLLAEETGIET